MKQAVGLGWPQEQEKLDLRAEVDSITMMWPLMLTEDGLECQGQLEPKPDKRYRDGQRPVWCLAVLSPGGSLAEAYDAVEEHRREVKHRGD